MKYAYNPRGWLKESISPKFKQYLKYDTLANAQYNGNISLQQWQHIGAGVQTYTYTYDRLNRLTEGTMPGNLGREMLTYDRMGNISSLEPTATYADGKPIDTSLYTYSWNIVGGTAVLANSFTLDVKKDSVVSVIKRSSPYADVYGEYDAFFRITNKQTKLAHDELFRIAVYGPTYEGWLLLCDPGDGTSRLDMVSRTDSDNLYRDVLGEVVRSDFPMDSPPVAIQFGYMSKIGVAGYGSNALIIITEKNAAVLNPELFEYEGKQADIANSFVSEHPTSYQGAVLNTKGYQNQFLLLRGDAFYFNNSYSFNFEKINVIDGVRFNAAPYVGNYEANLYSSVLFNEDTRSFVRLPVMVGYCLPMPMGRLFDYKTKQDLRYMKALLFNGRQEVFAILDSVGRSNLARFSPDGKEQYYYAPIINAPEFGQATHFTVDANFGNVFYAVKGRIYAYDFIGRSARLIQDYGDRDISYMESDSFNQDTESLVVCTYSRNDQKKSGQLDVFRLDRFDTPLRLVERHTGTGKVVSVTYRNR